MYESTYYRPKWFRYARAKPPEDGNYIVTLRGSNKAQSMEYKNGIWKDGRKRADVVAWMFFPEAYGTERAIE